MKSDRTIYPAVVNFFNAYLVERDISKTLSLVTADVYSIGTGEGEVAVGREEFAELLRQEVALLPGPIRYVIRDYTEKQCSEECWQCFCRMETCIGQEGGDEVYYKTRLTAAFHLVNGEYLASALHMSEPSGIQEEEEFFPLRYISKQTREVSENAQRELLDIFCRMMPGGIIGGYIEEDFPLYVVNDTMLEMLGYSYEEFMHACGGYVANTFCAEDREWVTEEVHRQLREGSEYAVEYRIRKKDGACIWVHDVGHTITAEDGRRSSACWWIFPVM